MQFTEALAQAIVAGQKTQTRRPLGDGEVLEIAPGDVLRVDVGDRVLARALVTAVARERVREISAADARAEGYVGPAQFFDAWRQLYPPAHPAFDLNRWCLAITFQLAGAEPGGDEGEGAEGAAAGHAEGGADAGGVGGEAGSGADAPGGAPSRPGDDRAAGEGDPPDVGEPDAGGAAGADGGSDGEPAGSGKGERAEAGVPAGAPVPGGEPVPGSERQAKVPRVRRGAKS